MALRLTFHNEINASVQINDMVYYSNPNMLGGYKTSSVDDIVLIGPVVKIANYQNYEYFKTNVYIVDNAAPSLSIFTADTSLLVGQLRFKQENVIPYDIPKEQIVVRLNGVIVDPVDYTWDVVPPSLSARNLTFLTPLVIGDELELELLRYIDVDDSNLVMPFSNLLDNGSFIMFSKSNSVNMSALKGYYAEVEFKNESSDKIELFSVGSEINESSK